MKKKRMKNFKAAIDRTALAYRTFALSRVSFICDSAVNMPGRCAPSARWLREIWCNFRFWAADSGLDICFRTKKLQERALGDFDRISSESLAWSKRNGTIIETFPIEKDLTDLQLVLRKAACLDVSYPLLLTGCWGGRYSYMQSNVFSWLVISFSDVCDGTYLKGTHWELQDACISVNKPWAISNRIEILDRIQLEFNNGWLGVYLEW